jgi:hypothetical protein
MQGEIQARADASGIYCGDCGGSGLDVGSLHEPEPCPACLGGRTHISAEIERKPVGREVRLVSPPVKTKTTRFTLYEQALEQLQEAFDALDQAHASMKGARVDDVESQGASSLSIKRIIWHLESLIGELETAECDDCGHKLTLRGDRNGCAYELGDTHVGCGEGGAVLAALGTCSCQWGLEVSGGGR